MSLALLPISAATYEPHALHHSDRPWTETNCWTDAAIEMLHALGLEPLAVAAYTVATDFEGDQWEMFKIPPADLWSTFGIEIHEMNPYRALDAQIHDLLELGRLMTIEVDAWYLPDTRGISYGFEHKKTSIIVNAIDREERTVGYFHNAGYYEAHGEDYDGLLRVGSHGGSLELLPYVELVRLDHLRHDDPQTLARHARELLRTHLARRPADNPVDRMAIRFQHDLSWISTVGESAFHTYAFVTARQCGAAADTVRGFCEWLAALDPEAAPSLLDSAIQWEALSAGAKSLQLRLARAARGRSVDLSETFAYMSNAWATAQKHLDTLAVP